MRFALCNEVLTTMPLERQSDYAAGYRRGVREARES